MIRRVFKLATTICLATGCNGTPPASPVRVDPGDAVAVVSYAELADVVGRAVGDDGRIEPDEFAEAQPALDALLARLAIAGPSSTPEFFADDADRLAYWYNARAGWSLKLLHLAGCPDELAPEPFATRKFTVDGRQMSLRRIDDVLLRLGGWRAIVSSPGVLVQRAAPLETPVSGQDVGERVEERFNAFIADGERVRLDVEHRRMLVPPVLWRFHRQLIDRYETTYGTSGATLTTALLPHVRGRARRCLQNAVGYRPVAAPVSGETLCPDR